MTYYILTNQIPDMTTPEIRKAVVSIRRASVTCLLGSFGWYCVELDVDPKSLRLVQHGVFTPDKQNGTQRLTSAMFGSRPGVRVVLKLSRAKQFSLAEIKGNYHHNEVFSLIQDLTVFEDRFYRNTGSPDMERVGIDDVGAFNSKEAASEFVLSRQQKLFYDQIKSKAIAEGDSDQLQLLLARFAASAIAYFWTIHDIIITSAELLRVMTTFLDRGIDLVAFDAVFHNFKDRLKRLKKRQEEQYPVEPALAEQVEAHFAIRPIDPLFCPIRSGEAFLKEVVRFERKSTGVPGHGLLFFALEKVQALRDSTCADLFCDGTHVRIPRFNQQLVVVMAKVPGDRSVPVFYWISQYKHTEAYSALFARVAELLGPVCRKAVRMHNDFELALLKAAAQHFAVTPCYFHGNQAFFRAKRYMEMECGKVRSWFLRPGKLLTIGPLVRKNIDLKCAVVFSQTISRRVLNASKVLFFVPRDRVELVLAWCDAHATSELERCFIRYTRMFMQRFGRYLPISPGEGRTNNCCEAYFSALKKALGMAATTRKLFDTIVVLDRQKVFEREAEPAETDLEEEMRCFAQFEGDDEELLSLLDGLAEFGRRADHERGDRPPETDLRKVDKHLTLNDTNLKRVKLSKLT
jgi:hypothetical protein